MVTDASKRKIPTFEEGDAVFTRVSQVASWSLRQMLHALIPGNIQMEKTKWTERLFTFDLPVSWFPVVVERLRGTSARLRDMTGNLTESETAIRVDNKWCIKEHIGHLSDLEELHTSRIDEFISRSPVLRAADMNNAKTYQADHVSKSIQKLLNDFSIKRRHYINRLLQIDEETHQFKSKHPRLNTFMRPVDLAYFTAEHDDHHLATMREIMERIGK